MNKFTRALFQILFWAVIWIVLGLSQNNFVHFLIENWMAYFFQSLLVLSLIYILVPQILFRKKFLVFGLISIGLLVLFAFVSSQFIAGHAGPLRPPPMHHNLGQRGAPSPFFINFLIITVAYILTIFVETFSFAQTKEEALILSKSETLETELKFLKSQINPHFLFNSLNNIYALSAIDAQKTQESILNLSDMLRYVLYECEKPKVAIEKEITYIEDFIKLFKLKSSKAYPIITTFSIDNPQLQIAPMLLIPFVENAFKHSNIHNILESFITIEIETKDEMIVFKIENSLNKEPVSKDKVGGIGMRNVQKRLSLLYAEKHELIISENSTSFAVTLKINTNV
ncbi:sensor histidine kinase [Flavobacterium sp. K5-23]|uniref:sensor histidine kinase n=1 Tax=Flavobacterium sp. K5-23 TaxID=2746225 RepID=UPI00200C293C|nr:sensor histidine kinase [Flavobacterium sp. K5-23]UQD55816.1 sensor histidine kinase [Flavobacterium sp. K5-23]